MVPSLIAGDSGTLGIIISSLLLFPFTTLVSWMFCDLLGIGGVHPPRLELAFENFALPLLPL